MIQIIFILFWPTLCLGLNISITDLGTCHPPLLTCSGTKKCILKSWLCDGIDDCGDNSDEISCPGCLRDDKLCQSGTDCAAGEQLCDLHKECKNGQAEGAFIDNCKTKEDLERLSCGYIC